MKTNVIMTSFTDRNLFGTVIRQQTKTGFLNLSDLQNCFDTLKVKKQWANKNIQELIARREHVERIYYILEMQDVITYGLSEFIENVERKGIATYLKTIGQYKTTGARHTKTTWVNPYIWTLIALELSPEFYAKTIIWLTDTLILNRIEAGNLYSALTKSISKFNPTTDQYIKLAKSLNFIVFNKHEAGIRNMASTKQLKELEIFESKMAFAIDMGYINTFDMLINELRKIWNEKYQLKITE